MFKNVLILMLCLILSAFSNKYFSQTVVDISPDLTSSIVEYEDTNGEIAYAYSSNHYVGRYNGQNPFNPNSVHDIFRSSFRFDLSVIPAGATISNAKLNISATNYDSQYGYMFSFNVTQIFLLLGANSASFAIPLSGNSVFSNIPNNYNSGPITSSNLLDDIINSRPTTYLYLGAYSNNESTNLSYATFNISLRVTYTPRVTNIPITVINDYQYETPLEDVHMDVDGSDTRIDPSGVTFTWASNTFPHTLGARDLAVEFNSGFYDTRLRHWNNGITDHTISIPATTNTYRATYDRNCYVNFITSESGRHVGTINVDGTHYNHPFPQFSIWTPYSMTVTAIAQPYDGFQYTFNRWDDNVTTNPRTFYPTQHEYYTAYFSGKPIYLDATRNLVVREVMNQPLHLSWSAHSSSLVTGYRIYRGIGSTGSAVLLATVSSGTLTYDDPDFVYNGKRNYNLYYDVRAYSSNEGTESDPSFKGLYFGGIMYKPNSLASNQPFENSIGNFPNPFNPETQISYSIKENGFVSIKVYDILGNKVADLVNEFKSAGSYSIGFDASSLPSGIYISTIIATNYTATKKMLLVK